MKKIADLFYEAAEKDPEKEAIWCDGESATYAEVSGIVSRYSNFMLHYGIQYGDHIGIAMNNSISSVAFMLAAANIGCVLVPVNPTLPADAIRISFASGNVKHVIARSYFLEQLQKADIKMSGVRICMDREFPGAVWIGEAKEFEAARTTTDQVVGEEPFIITLTSGSTGSPKPIMLTQKNKYDRAFAHIHMYKIKKEDRILAATPLYHSLAERLVLMPLLIGATSILLPRYTPELWLKCIKEQRVTFTIAVSAQLKQIAGLLQSDTHEIKTMRCIVSSSALLDIDTKKLLLKALKCDFHEMYGTSETSTVTDIDIKRCEEKKNSVGKPLPEAEIRILDQEGREKKKGTIGEIACRSKLLCSGYYGMSSVFSDALQEGYFKTGDLGYLDEDGFLYFTGRKKELIITGGINVYPADVEGCINQLPEVEECAAFPLSDERLGEIVAAAIVTKEGASLTKRTVQIWCAKNLADFQQPRELFFVDELPKNAMGKLVKSGLVDYVAQQTQKQNKCS